MKKIAKVIFGAALLACAASGFIGCSGSKKVEVGIVLLQEKHL